MHLDENQIHRANCARGALTSLAEFGSAVPWLSEAVWAEIYQRHEVTQATEGATDVIFCAPRCTGEHCKATRAAWSQQWHPGQRLYAQHAHLKQQHTYATGWEPSKEAVLRRGAGGRENFLPKATGLMVIFTTTALIDWEPTKCQALTGFTWIILKSCSHAADLNQVSFPDTHMGILWTVEAAGRSLPRTH